MARNPYPELTWRPGPQGRVAGVIGGIVLATIWRDTLTGHYMAACVLGRQTKQFRTEADAKEGMKREIDATFSSMGLILRSSL